MISRFNLVNINILCCCFFSLLAVGQDKITFSTPSFAPFYVSDNNKKCEGVSIAMFAKIVEGTNLLFKHVPYPYARILHSLKTGQLDIALILKNSDLAEFVNFVGPVSRSKVVVLFHNQHTIASYADLSKLRAIAVIRSAHFDNKFDNDNSLLKVEVEDYAQAIKMFKLGRVDGVIGSIVGLDYELRMQNIDVNILMNSFVLGEKELWLHLSKNSKFKYLEPQLSLALKRNYETDLLYKVYLEYIDKCLLINES